MPPTAGGRPASAGPAGFEAVVPTAIVGGITDEVVWSASGGTIAGDGDTIVVTPPATEGRYSVTASLASDPTVSAVARVDVVGVFLPTRMPGVPRTVTGR